MAHYLGVLCEKILSHHSPREHHWIIQHENIPETFFTIQKTDADWAFFAEPSEKFSKSLPQGSFWPRGKTLGGSGAINAMLYVRGNRRDYDRWEELGNIGWNYKNVLEYFKRSEDNLNPDVANAFEGKYHGTGGYLKVQQFSTKSPWIDTIIRAGEQLGYPHLKDINGEKNIGFGRAQGTIVNGTRCSPAKAFLVPVKDRQNLHVIKHARVINAERDTDGKFRWVNFFIDDKHLKAAKARKEIIISAGAINTPQILMLSGIGPKKLLESVGIDVVADLPVGKNLQDHPIVPVLIKLNKSSAKPYNLQQELIKSLNEYLLHRTGPLAAHGVTSLTAFINTANETDLYPDVQLHFFEFPKESKRSVLFTSKVGYDEEVSKSFLEAAEETDVLMVLLTLLNPKSKGSITINSQDIDPYKPPVINAAFLGENEDVETIVRAVRVIQKLITTQELKDNEAELHQMSISGCDELQYDSEEYWQCYVRHLTLTLYHPVGTAKMGPIKDPSAVVDSKLKVHKVSGLRVADGSIMPNIVSGNTNAPIIMIGEKVSDMIKQDWVQKSVHSEL